MGAFALLARQNQEPPQVEETTGGSFSFVEVTPSSL
jgi:hypothetical protein